MSRGRKDSVSIPGKTLRGSGTGRLVTRRDVLRYSGGAAAGIAGLAMFGIPVGRVLAQDSPPGPTVLFNDTGTAPTAPAGTLTVALAFDPVNIDSIATYTL